MAEAYYKHAPPISAIKGDPPPFSGRVFQDKDGNYYECMDEDLWRYVPDHLKIDITKLSNGS